MDLKLASSQITWNLYKPITVNLYVDSKDDTSFEFHQMRIIPQSADETSLI